VRQTVALLVVGLTSDLIGDDTPHLEDKYKGTRTIVDILTEYDRIEPSRVMIDHAEEHTLPMILENGFWTGLTLYPQTKVSPERAIDMYERYGTERICVASACDWGPSLPDAVPHFALAMRRRGHAADLIDGIIYGNPIAFLGQSPKFRLEPAPATTASAPLPRAESDAKSSAGVAAA
jgi:predicted metal-dependent TIM-barrel fold hydrolase